MKTVWENLRRRRDCILKAANERKKFAEKYFGGNWDEGHEARFHSIQGKAWQAREAYEKEKAEKGEGPKPNVYNLWRDCFVEG